MRDARASRLRYVAVTWLFQVPRNVLRRGVCVGTSRFFDSFWDLGLAVFVKCTFLNRVGGSFDSHRHERRTVGNKKSSGRPEVKVYPRLGSACAWEDAVGGKGQRLCALTLCLLVSPRRGFSGQVLLLLPYLIRLLPSAPWNFNVRQL